MALESPSTPPDAAASAGVNADTAPSREINSSRFASPFSPIRAFSEPPPAPENFVLRAPLTHTWQTRPDHEWRTEYRHHLPYWQQSDPVPPQPLDEPALETPGEALNERQEAFCRAYVERPVAAKAARLAGYSPASAALPCARPKRRSQPVHDSCVSRKGCTPPPRCLGMSMNVHECLFRGRPRPS